MFDLVCCKLCWLYILDLVIHVDSGCLELRKSDFVPAFGLRGYWMPGMRKSPYGRSHCHPREESPKAR